MLGGTFPHPPWAPGARPLPISCTGVWGAHQLQAPAPPPLPPRPLSEVQAPPPEPPLPSLAPLSPRNLVSSSPSHPVCFPGCRLTPPPPPTVCPQPRPQGAPRCSPLPLRLPSLGLPRLRTPPASDPTPAWKCPRAPAPGGVNPEPPPNPCSPPSLHSALPRPSTSFLPLARPRCLQEVSALPSPGVPTSIQTPEPWAPHSASGPSGFPCSPFTPQTP